MLRTKTCGQLRGEDVEQSVTVCGWVDSRRDHGGLVFIDLRDRYGKVQVVIDPTQGQSLHDLAGAVRNEDVLRVTGRVVRRAEKDVNPKLATGEIDIRANVLEVLNKSRVVPFEPGTTTPPNEELRLKYRFLDLRRPRLQELMLFRHRLTKLVRDYFDRHG
ncbi:MAG TPA: OB-fold nucleic acid binding domain-containing protein, partial [Planctomycetaceae bacterium]|nr:OB-fold nucleic acid binding domain-containing protein [Planctomycetaceae bacterium]